MLLPPGYTSIERLKRTARRAWPTARPSRRAEELIERGVVIVGSPNTVREKLAAYQDLAGFNISLTKTQFGTMPHSMVTANQARHRPGSAALFPRPGAAAGTVHRR